VAPDFSLVVPCYNEASHLRTSVTAVLEMLDQTRWDWELVFVDDHSRDETREIIRELCAGDSRMRYVFHEYNRGRGAAFKTGFAATTGRVTGFIDIDLEVNARYVPALVNVIERHGADVATGLRFYLVRQTGALHRILLSWVYRALIRVLLNVSVVDTETGCKFFKRATATDAVLGSESDGWFWDTEVMARAALAGLTIEEMPVLFLRRFDKRSTVRVWRDSWDYLRELFRFRGRAGFGLQRRSPIYWTGVGYDCLMRVLYRGQYRQTFAAVADLVPKGASVVDVCCGTARLGRDFLVPRGCRYLGLDANAHFVMAARRAGVTTRVFDLRSDPIPPADYVVMCSSFYHAHDFASDVLTKLVAAARCAVIISEPVHNLSNTPVVGRLAAALTNPGAPEYRARYDLASFLSFGLEHGAEQFLHHPGDRNAIAVFRGAGVGAPDERIAAG
jgi:glycosyltransferase involved in cell wall biosynthesis